MARKTDMNYKEMFNTIQQSLVASKLWNDMESCIEQSPFHREPNVAIHTKMALEEYWVLCSTNWTVNDFIVSVVLLFHDVGKPKSKIEKLSIERGKYFAFTGHELQSSRIFIDFVLSSPQLKPIFTNELLFVISWLIENHKPWNITNKKSISDMCWTISKFIGNVDVFLDILLSDNYGRISDDSTQNNKKAEDWCANFKSQYLAKVDYFNVVKNNDAPKAYFMIGASGSGKTTFRNQLGNLPTFSMDDLRIELYGNDYTTSYHKSTKDTHFKAKCKERLLDIARLNSDMIVDNTNTIKNTRQYHLNELKNRKYHTFGVVFLTAYKSNVDRQATRFDKTVPVEAINSQYWKMQLPSLGEFDEILIVVN